MSASFKKFAMPMSAHEWWLQANRAASWYWCYPELLDDAHDELEARQEAGEDPYEAIKEVGQSLDLHEFGPAWGGW